MTQEIKELLQIKITSNLFGTICIPANHTMRVEYDKSSGEVERLDIWTSLGDHIDINVFDVGDGTIQATIYPVLSGELNTAHILESLQGDNIELITS
tara:strand:- start:681 stop:971 length:291 start_codon:yes stop_codon:yes gene_type:complete